MNETCDRCGPAVRAVYHASRGGQLYLCGHCATQLRPALSAQGWAIRPVAVPLLAAGFIAGTGWRMLTAAVIRTKMGAGLVILLGSPAVAVLLAWGAGPIDLPGAPAPSGGLKPSSSVATGEGRMTVTGKARAPVIPPWPCRHRGSSSVTWLVV